MSDFPPKLLAPLEITDAMVTSSDIAEPAAGETAWVSAGTYVVGDRRIRATTHRMYECILGHTGITTLPEDDPSRWIDIKPTKKWAMFDSSCSTQTTNTTSLTAVMAPGFFNGLALYGLDGGTLDITLKDEPGGTTVYSDSVSLIGPYDDEYDWCWGPHRTLSKHVVSGLLPYPAAELTLAVSGGAGTTVGVGMVALGDLRALLLGDWGGTQYGAQVDPVDYSYIKINDFGDSEIVRRRSATDLTITVIMEKADSEYALRSMQEVLAVPMAFIATEATGYDGLNVFGLGSASLRYEGPNHVSMQIKVKGLV